MLGYVYVIIKNSKYGFNNEDIEEIASDVFLAIWQSRNKLEINKEITPYIAGITKNLILKKQKKIKKTTLNIEVFEKSIHENIDIHNKAEKDEQSRIIIEELLKMNLVLP